jgi:hypothetical protein
MGTPGALAEGVGFDSSLLMAFSPPTAPGDEARHAVELGLGLPGTSPGGKLMSLQSVLKLSVGSVALTRGEAGGGAEAFVLRLNRIGLSVVGLVDMPAGATMNFFLFGSPEGDGALGWYAAYNKDKPKPDLPRLPGTGERP